MSRSPRPLHEIDEVARRLAPLSRATADVPSAETVYWRAQARLAIDEAARRQRSVLRPLRVFQRTIGGGAILAAAAVIWPWAVPSSPTASLLAVPILTLVVTAGGLLLAESADPGTSRGRSGSRRQRLVDPGASAS